MVDDIKNTFRELSNKGKRHAGVLIIPPVNSVAVLIAQDMLQFLTVISMAATAAWFTHVKLNK